MLVSWSFQGFFCFAFFWVAKSSILCISKSLQCFKDQKRFEVLLLWLVIHIQIYEKACGTFNPHTILFMYFSWTTPAVRRMSETFNMIHISTWEQDKFTLTQEKTNKQTVCPHLRAKNSAKQGASSFTQRLLGRQHILPSLSLQIAIGQKIDKP